MSSLSGCISTQTFSTVADDTESHDSFIEHLKQQSADSIRVCVGPTSLRSTLGSMETGDASAVGTMQLAGMFSQSKETMTLALTFRMDAANWSVYSGFVTESDGSLQVIDFRSRERAKPKPAEDDDDVMAAADRAMNEANAAEQGGSQIDLFEKAAKEYTERLARPDFEFGSPMPLSQDTSYNLVVNETFNPSTLLGLFKDNVAELAEGLTLIFTKRASVEDNTALVVITPLGQGCIGLHMMSYCVSGDD